MKRIKPIAIIILLMMVALNVTSIYAGDSIKSLILESTNISEGEIEANQDIKLVFNKNVVNIVIKEDNIKCFTLYDGDTIIPIDVVMGDDQVDREIRRDVIIKPKVNLEKGKTYKLVIDKNFSAKSGVKLGKNKELDFKLRSINESVQYLVLFTTLIVLTLIYFIVKSKTYVDKA